MPLLWHVTTHLDHCISAWFKQPTGGEKIKLLFYIKKQGNILSLSIIYVEKFGVRYIYGNAIWNIEALFLPTTNTPETQNGRENGSWGPG